MKKINYLILAICATSILSSCINSPNCITGSGEIISNTRKTDTFENITINGSCNVDINRGDSLSVIVSDYSNLIDMIETKVEKNELKISYKKGTCTKNSKIEIIITMPHIKGIEIKGSGSANINGNFKEDIIYANISGSGDISLKLTDTTALLKSEINGSGTINAVNSVCDSAIAEVKGSGDINVSTIKYLKAKISGSGNITYKGSPKTDIKIKGSGEVKQK